MKQKIALVLADVDGTLVTQDKELTQDAIAAVRALRQAGIKFAITSGRPPRGMRMLIEPLSIDTPIAGFNGGIFTAPDLSPLERHTLPPDAAKETLQLILDQGLDAWIYNGDDWLIRDENAPHVAKEASTVEFAAKVVAKFTEAHLQDVVKIVGISDDLDKVKATEQMAREKLGKHASAARSQPYYLDVTNPDANKAGVVRYLSRHFNIPTDQIATLGDQSNDVAMFNVSGFSVAMGNANDEVKAQASATTDSNEQNGFAHAIHRLILGDA